MRPKGPKTIFLETSPLSQGLDDGPPPPPLLSEGLESGSASVLTHSIVERILVFNGRYL